VVSGEREVGIDQGESVAATSESYRDFVKRHPGRAIDRGGLSLHYIDEGSGPAVVMIHGNPTWSILFRHLIDDLNGSYRVVVPDQIGCGLSEKPDDSRYSYTLASRVDDFEFLLDSLGLDRELTLVMHDWGGMIGMTYAARHPDRVARLVVCNTAAFHKPAAKSFPLALSLCRHWALGSLLVRGLNIFCRGTTWIGCKRQPMDRDLRAAYVAPYDSWEHRIAILRFVQDIPLSPQDRSFGLVSWVEQHLPLLSNVPMLVLWGMKDFVFDRYCLDEWLRRFPHAEVVRFPEAGHLLFEDEPEPVGRAVRSFLQVSLQVRERVG
jgi:cis-3-alkyl-4-acyloxetan-2-one decarboxylase